MVKYAKFTDGGGGGMEWFGEIILSEKCVYGNEKFIFIFPSHAPPRKKNFKFTEMFGAMEHTNTLLDYIFGKDRGRKKLKFSYKRIREHL